MKIIKFYEEYGEKATKEAFGASRQVISSWKKRLKESGGSLSALIPHSTRPHRVRCSDVSPKIIDFIKELRDKNMKIWGHKLVSPFSLQAAENYVKFFCNSLSRRRKDVRTFKMAFY